MLTHIKKYTEYNLWANKKIIGKLTGLPESVLNTELKSSFRSITLTVLHIYDAETIWLKRLLGESVNKWPSEDFNGTPNDSLNMLENASKNFADYSVSVTDNSISNDISFRSIAGDKFTMSVQDIVQHCMNHSSFHRGQIITMLRELDVTDLPSTDYIAFLRTNER